MKADRCEVKGERCEKGLLIFPSHPTPHTSDLALLIAHTSHLTPRA